MQNRLLVIDDDRELCALLAEYLGAEGFVVDAVHDGICGGEAVTAGDYALVILDVMLPGMNGFELLRKIRATSSVPVVMLTARGEEVDRIVGLEMGADDYLPKPFNPRELVARIKAVQRRFSTSAAENSQPEPVLTIGDLTIDPGRRSVHRGDTNIQLTSLEFSVLEMLLNQAGKVVSREDICCQALGRPLNAYDRSIDVHISSLRRKLGRTADAEERIKSIRGVGYIYLRPVDML